MSGRKKNHGRFRNTRLGGYRSFSLGRAELTPEELAELEARKAAVLAIKLAAPKEIPAECRMYRHSEAIYRACGNGTRQGRVVWMG